MSQAAVATTASSLGPASFSVGAGLDSASQASLASSTGLNSVRLSIPWKLGSSAPDSATVSQLQSIPASKRLIVELSTESLPTDTAGRSALAAFTRLTPRAASGTRRAAAGPGSNRGERLGLLGRIGFATRCRESQGIVARRGRRTRRHRISKGDTEGAGKGLVGLRPRAADHGRVGLSSCVGGGHERLDDRQLRAARGGAQ